MPNKHQEHTKKSLVNFIDSKVHFCTLARIENVTCNNIAHYNDTIFQDISM